MDREPRVTVIIPHHNYQHFLNVAINSALRQVYSNFNICLIDDCSDDFDSVISIFNSLIPLKSQKKETMYDGQMDIYTSDCGNHTLLRLNVNQGPSTARNVAIQYYLERGTEAFVNLDADDSMMPDKLTKFVEAWCIDRQKIGVVYGDYYTDNNIRRRIEFKEPYKLSRLQQECIVHSGSLISKEALLATYENNGFYDPMLRTCEDFDLWLRISEKFMIYHVAEPLTNVLIQPGNSTLTVAKDTWNANWQRVMLKAKQRANDKANK